MDEVLDHTKDHDLAMCERDRVQNEETVQKLAYTEGATKGEEDGVQAGFNKSFAESCKSTVQKKRQEIYDALCKELLPAKKQAE